MVSERQIPGYKDTMKYFYTGPYDTETLPAIGVERFGPTISVEVGDFQPIAKTTALLTDEECRTFINEAERIAATSGWSTKRHGSFPTTDLPMQDLPESLDLLNTLLKERILPALGDSFSDALPGSMTNLRVADAFVVKYSAAGGQTELKPHRDGSVLSFNIALNECAEFEGGGTWFASIDRSLRIDRGEMVMHASGVLHAGHPITSGTRYILVGFVLLEGFQNYAMRFMNACWDN